MTMHFDWSIRPETMDPSRLELLQKQLKNFVTKTLNNSVDGVVMSASEVHALLCHLESIEQVVARQHRYIKRMEAQLAEEDIRPDIGPATDWPCIQA